MEINLMGKLGFIPYLQLDFADSTISTKIAFKPFVLLT